MQNIFFIANSIALSERDLAQPGRALALGARCRRFESYSPDQTKNLTLVVRFFYFRAEGSNLQKWVRKQAECKKAQSEIL